MGEGYQHVAWIAGALENCKGAPILGATNWKYEALSLIKIDLPIKIKR